jgi:hypothetical protein
MKFSTKKKSRSGSPISIIALAAGQDRKKRAERCLTAEVGRCLCQFKNSTTWERWGGNNKNTVPILLDSRLGNLHIRTIYIGTLKRRIFLQWLERRWEAINVSMISGSRTWEAMRSDKSKAMEGDRCIYGRWAYVSSHLLSPLIASKNWDD